MKVMQKHRNAIAAALVAGLLGFGIGMSSGESSGFAKGRVSGFNDGTREGWRRGIDASTEKIWWDGVVTGCIAVFSETGWQFIPYREKWGMVEQDTFCKDGGDHSATPSFDIPFVAAPSE